MYREFKPIAPLRPYIQCFLVKLLRFFFIAVYFQMLQRGKLKYPAFPAFELTADHQFFEIGETGEVRKYRRVGPPVRPDKGFKRLNVLKTYR